MNTRTQRQGKTIPKIANERLVIRGGNVVNHDLTFKADVLIENGIIKEVGSELVVPGGVPSVDARGAYVMPGGVDVSTGLQRSFKRGEGGDVIETCDDFYSGTRAAVAGGTTTIVDFASCGTQMVGEFAQRRQLAAESSCCDFSLHCDVTCWSDEAREAMTSLSRDHGVASFRVFMSDENMMSDEQLYEIFEHVRSLGAIALVHAENGSLIRKKAEKMRAAGQALRDPRTVGQLRSEELECEAVDRAITIAQQVDCPIFFWNVTGVSALNRIDAARKKGLPVYGQALAVSLVQDGSSYRQSSWNKSVSSLTWPPLRDDPTIRRTLLDSLASGTLQCLSSGHTLYTNLDKAKAGKLDASKIPPGTNGIYERMMTLWSVAVQPGHIDVNEFVALTSTNAARLLNLYPRKGRIAVGADADLVLWRAQERQLAVESEQLGIAKSDCGNSFEHVESKGGASVVISRGKIVFQDDQLNVVQSHGQFVPLAPFAPSVYAKMQNRQNLLPASAAASTTTPTAAARDHVTRPQSASVNHEQADQQPSSGRFTRSGGHRAMHQSGWSFSGEQVDDTVQNKSMIRCYKPPGGTSQIQLS